MDDTIAAIATPPGAGAIALLRVSGPHACDVADKIFRGARSLTSARPRTAYVGKIVDKGETVDQVVATVYRAPASYTGEDLVEITCHGGTLVTRRILQLLLAAGARSAAPGEFTQRAFLNGKMDLTQAEAVMDLIHARSTLALKAAGQQLEGTLGRAVESLREELLQTLAHLEAYIDFPEEGIDPDSQEALLGRVAQIQQEITRLLDTADEGRILREGALVAICGKPNAGKSSLLNRLAGYERAIVHDQPGTTRDTVEVDVTLQGVPFRLVDTAGLRDAEDVVERAGIERARKAIQEADIVLHVIEPADLSDLPAAVRDDEILVLNKADLLAGNEGEKLKPAAQKISCLTGEGIQALAEAVVAQATGGRDWTASLAVAINARHQDCLRRAAGALAATEKALRDGLPPEFVSIELRTAVEAVGEIAGRVDTEELLGKIFSLFCIGK